MPGPLFYSPIPLFYLVLLGDFFNYEECLKRKKKHQATATTNKRKQEEEEEKTEVYADIYTVPMTIWLHEKE